MAVYSLRRIRPLSLAVAIAFSSLPAWADEELYFTDLPVVASVSRLPQRLADASASVTVIDRDMIKASGARNLNDVLRLVPGFQTFPNNTDPARVTYHGLTDEAFAPRVQVLVDGRSQYSPLFRNGVNWATIPVALQDIERIEVVRGSNAVSYGSNAFLGVINIVTVEPDEVHGVSVGGNRGSQGVRDVTVRGGGQLSQNASVRFTYQALNDDGLDNRFDWQDSFKSRLFNVESDVWLTQHDQFRIGFGHIDAVTERGRLASSKGVLTGGVDPANPFRDFSQSSSYAQMHWRHVQDADSDFQLRYAYTEDRASEAHIQRYTIGTVRVGSIRVPHIVQVYVDEMGDFGNRHELEGQHTTRLGETLRTVLGAGYRLDSLHSETQLYDGDAIYRRVGRIFGNLEWRPSTWFTGNLGAAREYDSLAGRNFSPRASANFHLTPDHTLRVSGSRAYRTGSVVDYRGDSRLDAFHSSVRGTVPPGTAFRRSFLGDPNMEQERITSVDVGYLGELKALRSSLDVRVFRERIPNRMLVISRLLPDLRPCDTVPHSVSSGAPPCTAPDYTTPVQRVKITGVEYQWRWQPFDDTRLSFGQSFIRIDSSDHSGVAPGVGSTDFADPINRAEIKTLTEDSAPRRSTTALLMQKLPGGVDASIAAYWVDSMKWTRHSAVGFYRRIDLRLGYPFKIGGQSGEIAYTAQSANGKHGEFRSEGKPSDRVVDTRQWVSLRLDL